jgi:glycosyltransferase involved in cell wall biosynthesis
MKSSLLILTPRFPYPVVGGDRLRIYQICKALSNKYHLTLLSLCDSKHELEMDLPNEGVFQRVERIFLPKWRSWLNCALALPTDMPLQIAYYNSKSFKNRALQLMAEHDGVFAHLIRVGDVIKHARGIKFLEMTDAISLNYSRIQSANYFGIDFRARIYALETSRLKRYEQEIVDHFDYSFLVSQVDKEYLFKTQMERWMRVGVCTNGVSLEAMPYQFEKNGRDIIFIGNMHSMQNFDAALYMAKEILPLVRKAFPDVRLRLIGRNNDKQIVKLKQFEGVEVSGEVASIAQAAQGGAVGVCPLRLGAGVQNKVLEYMALGLPVVSTSIGLEGFNARNGIEIVVADTAKLFAEEVINLLKDRDNAASMAKAARRYVEVNHGWDSKLSPMLDIVDSYLEGKI